MGVLKEINKNPQGIQQERFLPAAVVPSAEESVAAKLPPNQKEKYVKIKESYLQQERERLEKLGVWGRLKERTWDAAKTLTCNSAELLGLVGVSILGQVGRGIEKIGIKVFKGESYLDYQATEIENIKKFFAEVSPNGSILSNKEHSPLSPDKSLAANLWNSAKLGFGLVTYPTTLLINTALGVISTAFEEVDRRIKNQGYAEYLKTIEENPSFIRDSLNLLTFISLSVLTAGRAKVPTPMLIRSMRVLQVMIPSLGMGTAGALGEQLMRVENANEGGFNVRKLASDAIQGALASSIFMYGMKGVKSIAYREFADMSDGTSDLFDTFAETGRVEIQNDQISIQAKAARLLGFGLKLGTAAYDLNDAAILSKKIEVHKDNKSEDPNLTQDPFLLADLLLRNGNRTVLEDTKNEAAILPPTTTPIKVYRAHTLEARRVSMRLQPIGPYEESYSRRNRWDNSSPLRGVSHAMSGETRGLPEDDGRKRRRKKTSYSLENLVQDVESGLISEVKDFFKNANIELREAAVKWQSRYEQHNLAHLAVLMPDERKQKVLLPMLKLLHSVGVDMTHLGFANPGYDLPNDNDYPPIHYLKCPDRFATKHSKEELEAIAWLKSIGADENQYCKDRALRYACFDNNLYLAKFMLEDGADPDFTYKRVVSHTEPEQNTTLLLQMARRHGAMSGLQGIVYDTYDITKLLLEYRANPNKKEGIPKESPLHLIALYRTDYQPNMYRGAAKAKHSFIEYATLLLEYDANPLLENDTPLNDAASRIVGRTSGCHTPLDYAIIQDNGLEELMRSYIRTLVVSPPAVIVTNVSPPQRSSPLIPDPVIDVEFVRLTDSSVPRELTAFPSFQGHFGTELLELIEETRRVSLEMEKIHQQFGEETRRRSIKIFEDTPTLAREKNISFEEAQAELLRLHNADIDHFNKVVLLEMNEKYADLMKQFREKCQLLLARAEQEGRVEEFDITSRPAGLPNLDFNILMYCYYLTRGGEEREMFGKSKELLDLYQQLRRLGRETIGEVASRNDFGKIINAIFDAKETTTEYHCVEEFLGLGRRSPNPSTYAEMVVYLLHFAAQKLDIAIQNQNHSEVSRIQRILAHTLQKTLKEARFDPKDLKAIAYILGPSASAAIRQIRNKAKSEMSEDEWEQRIADLGQRPGFVGEMLMHQFECSLYGVEPGKVRTMLDYFRELARGEISSTAVKGMGRNVGAFIGEFTPTIEGPFTAKLNDPGIEIVPFTQEDVLDLKHLAFTGIIDEFRAIRDLSYLYDEIRGIYTQTDYLSHLELFHSKIEFKKIVYVNGVPTFLIGEKDNRRVLFRYPKRISDVEYSLEDAELLACLGFISSQTCGLSEYYPSCLYLLDCKSSGKHISITELQATISMTNARLVKSCLRLNLAARLFADLLSEVINSENQINRISQDDVREICSVIGPSLKEILLPEDLKYFEVFKNKLLQDRNVLFDVENNSVLEEFLKNTLHVINLEIRIILDKLRRVHVRLPVINFLSSEKLDIKALKKSYDLIAQLVAKDGKLFVLGNEMLASILVDDLFSSGATSVFLPLPPTDKKSRKVEIQNKDAIMAVVKAALRAGYVCDNIITTADGKMLADREGISFSRQDRVEKFRVSKNRKYLHASSFAAIEEAYIEFLRNSDEILDKSEANLKRLAQGVYAFYNNNTNPKQFIVPEASLFTPDRKGRMAKAVLVKHETLHEEIEKAEELKTADGRTIPLPPVGERSAELNKTIEQEIWWRCELFLQNRPDFPALKTNKEPLTLKDVFPQISLPKNPKDCAALSSWIERIYSGDEHFAAKATSTSANGGITFLPSCYQTGILEPETITRWNRKAKKGIALEQWLALTTNINCEVVDFSSGSLDEGLALDMLNLVRTEILHLAPKTKGSILEIGISNTSMVNAKIGICYFSHNNATGKKTLVGLAVGNVLKASEEVYLGIEYVAVIPEFRKEATSCLLATFAKVAVERVLQICDNLKTYFAFSSLSKIDTALPNISNTIALYRAAFAYSGYSEINCALDLRIDQTSEEDADQMLEEDSVDVNIYFYNDPQTLPENIRDAVYDKELGLEYQRREYAGIPARYYPAINFIVIGEGEGEVGDKALELMRHALEIKKAGKQHGIKMEVPETVVLTQGIIEEILRIAGLGNSLNEISETDIEGKIFYAIARLRLSTEIGGEIRLLIEGILKSHFINSKYLFVRSNGRGDATGHGTYTSFGDRNTEERTMLSLARVISGYYSEDARELRASGALGNGFAIIIQAAVGEEFKEGAIFGPKISGNGVVVNDPKNHSQNIVVGSGGGVSAGIGVCRACKVTEDDLLEAEGSFLKLREIITKRLKGNSGKTVAYDRETSLFSRKRNRDVAGEFFYAVSGHISRADFNIDDFEVESLDRFYAALRTLRGISGNLDLYIEWAYANGVFAIVQIAKALPKKYFYISEEIKQGSLIRTAAYGESFVIGGGEKRFRRIIFCHSNEQLIELEKLVTDPAIFHESIIVVNSNMGITNDLRTAPSSSDEIIKRLKPAALLEVGLSHEGDPPPSHWQGALGLRKIFFSVIESPPEGFENNDFPKRYGAVWDPTLGVYVLEKDGFISANEMGDELYVNVESSQLTDLETTTQERPVTIENNSSIVTTHSCLVSDLVTEDMADKALLHPNFIASAQEAGFEVDHLVDLGKLVQARKAKGEKVFLYKVAFDGKIEAIFFAEEVLDETYGRCVKVEYIGTNAEHRALDINSLWLRFVEDYGKAYLEQGLIPIIGHFVKDNKHAFFSYLAETLAEAFIEYEFDEVNNGEALVTDTRLQAVRFFPLRKADVTKTSEVAPVITLQVNSSTGFSYDYINSLLDVSLISVQAALDESIKTPAQAARRSIEDLKITPILLYKEHCNKYQRTAALEKCDALKLEELNQLIIEANSLINSVSEETSDAEVIRIWNEIIELVVRAEVMVRGTNDLGVYKILVEEEDVEKADSPTDKMVAAWLKFLSGRDKFLEDLPTLLKKHKISEADLVIIKEFLLSQDFETATQEYYIQGIKTTDYLDWLKSTLKSAGIKNLRFGLIAFTLKEKLEEDFFKVVESPPQPNGPEQKTAQDTTSPEYHLRRTREIAQLSNEQFDQLWAKVVSAGVREGDVKDVLRYQAEQAQCLSVDSRNLATTVLPLNPQEQIKTFLALARELISADDLESIINGEREDCLLMDNVNNVAERVFCARIVFYKLFLAVFRNTEVAAVLDNMRIQRLIIENYWLRFIKLLELCGCNELAYIYIYPVNDLLRKFASFEMTPNNFVPLNISFADINQPSSFFGGDTAVKYFPISALESEIGEFKILKAGFLTAINTDIGTILKDHVGLRGIQKWGNFGDNKYSYPPYNHQNINETISLLAEEAGQAITVIDFGSGKGTIWGEILESNQNIASLHLTSLSSFFDLAVVADNRVETHLCSFATALSDERLPKAHLIYSIYSDKKMPRTALEVVLQKLLPVGVAIIKLSGDTDNPFTFADLNQLALSYPEIEIVDRHFTESEIKAMAQNNSLRSHDINIIKIRKKKLAEITFPNCVAEPTGKISCSQDTLYALEDMLRILEEDHSEAVEILTRFVRKGAKIFSLEQVRAMLGDPKVRLLEFKKDTEGKRLLCEFNIVIRELMDDQATQSLEAEIESGKLNHYFKIDNNCIRFGYFDETRDRRNEMQGAIEIHVTKDIIYLHQTAVIEQRRQEATMPLNVVALYHAIKRFLFLNNLKSGEINFEIRMILKLGNSFNSLPNIIAILHSLLGCLGFDEINCEIFIKEEDNFIDPIESIGVSVGVQARR